MATRKPKSTAPVLGSGVAPPQAATPLAAARLMFKIGTGRDLYDIEVHEHSTGSPRAALVDGTLHVRAGSSSADLIDALNAAAVLVERHDEREDENEDESSLCEYVDRLAGLIEAALPSFHPVALCFRNVLAEYSDVSRPARVRLAAAVETFDALPTAEKRRIFNGWHVPLSRPETAALKEPPCDTFVYRVLELATGGHRSTGRWGYRLDDMAGVEPVRVLITEGTSKRDVLTALRELTDLVNAAWEPVVGFEGECMPIPAVSAYFAGDFDRTYRDPPFCADGQRKSGSSPTPNVPELGGNRNEKARRAMPASSEHSE